MKITTRIFLGSALSAVLLSPSAMLAADQGGDTHSRAATTQRPGLIKQMTPASPPWGHMHLDDGQLDAIKAGQIVGGDAPLLDVELNVIGPLIP
jgi:hypothetical protein